MSLTEEFKARLRDASNDELRGMYRRLSDFGEQKQKWIKREMEVRGLEADESHRDREVEHMDTVQRQGWWQLAFGGVSLGIQLIRVGGPFVVGLMIGFALGQCSG